MSLTALQLGLGGLDQSGADVVPEAEVAAGCLGVAGAGLCPALLVGGCGVAHFVVVEAGAGEVGLLPCRRGCVVFEFLVDEVDHEGGVDDPDRGGESCPRSWTKAYRPLRARSRISLVMRTLSARVRARAARVSSSRSSLSASQPSSPTTCRWPSAARWIRAWSICSAPSSSAPSSIRTA